MTSSTELSVRELVVTAGMNFVRLSMWRQLVVALLHGLLIGAAAAGAQTTAGPDLTKVDVSSYPWSSIAKLNNSVGGSCTGVVIEQDKVLTAAHCIFNRRTGRFLPASSLHVLLGYERGRFAFHALADNYAIGSGYEAQQKIADPLLRLGYLNIDRTAS